MEQYVYLIKHRGISGRDRKVLTTYFKVLTKHSEKSNVYHAHERQMVSSNWRWFAEGLSGQLGK